MVSLLGLPNEILIEIFKHLDNIDSVIWLARSCRQVYHLYDSVRLEIIKHVILHSEAHRHDVRLCHFNDSFRAFSSSQLQTGQRIARDAHPPHVRFDECLNADDLSPGQVWDILARWQGLKVIRDLYTNCALPRAAHEALEAYDFTYDYLLHNTQPASMPASLAWHHDVPTFDDDPDPDADANWHGFMSELRLTLAPPDVLHLLLLTSRWKSREASGEEWGPERKTRWVREEGVFEVGSGSPDVVDSGSSPDEWFAMEHLVEACGEQLRALRSDDADNNNNSDNNDNSGVENASSGSSNGNGSGAITTTTTTRDQGERNNAAPTVDVMELWKYFRAKKWQGEARGNFRGLLDAFERFEGSERRRVKDFLVGIRQTADVES
ncbi:putative f-box domain protein [Diplodia seriata]|uniref:Putative f-box domain protein n=1 Tax=Diplodia seriata TaxID=420778 RepID=A0A0G2ETW9_9PEZI|nr:putative f-box domain protein [Diplodia seriata]